MKRILITGITGFVGTSLVRFFQASNIVKIFGHSRNQEKVRKNSFFDEIDFIPAISAEEIDKNKIDCIIHLAGIAHDLSGSYEQQDYQKANFENTRNIFLEFTKSKGNTFVFVSSIKAVVDHADFIITEDHVPSPTSYYGISKRNAEEYILSHNQNEKRIFVLRPCMIHGPGNKGNLNLLYKFVKSGIPYPLGVFENKRSFLSMDNFSFVIEHIIDDTLIPGTYFLSDNDSISTNDLVRLIGRGINKKARILRLPKSVILVLARLGSWTAAPFNSDTVSKLCENMVVSNKKLLLNLNKELPVSTTEGLNKTIRSFNE